MVEVYGADGCGDMQRTRRQLDRLGVAYRYINVEHDPQASAWVKQQNAGQERKPTVKVGAQVLAEPSDEALEQALRHEGLVPQGMRQVWPGVIKPVAPHMLRHSFAPY
jgi:mycoredoxin